MVEDYQRWEPAVPVSRDSGMRAGVAVPLIVDDRPHGVLAVAAYILRRFDPEQVQALTILGSQIGPALEAARLRTEVLSGLGARWRRCATPKLTLDVTWPSPKPGSAESTSPWTAE